MDWSLDDWSLDDWSLSASESSPSVGGGGRPRHAFTYERVVLAVRNDDDEVALLLAL